MFNSCAKKFELPEKQSVNKNLLYDACYLTFPKTRSKKCETYTFTWAPGSTFKMKVLTIILVKVTAIENSPP